MIVCAPTTGSLSSHTTFERMPNRESLSVANTIILYNVSNSSMASYCVSKNAVLLPASGDKVTLKNDQHCR